MPLKAPSLLWVVIGVVVAYFSDYFDSLGTIARIFTAILAVLLWPLILIGFDVRVTQ